MDNHLEEIQQHPATSWGSLPVVALDPGEVGVGVVDQHTQIYTLVDDAGEFTKVHVVPFILPAAFSLAVPPYPVLTTKWCRFPGPPPRDPPRTSPNSRRNMRKP